ncbi:MAG: hypothetical protein LBQ32_12675 [Burkholderiaceae bacterium]|nr:hypothetical protein [Burkholderiaceae bacterium]
MSISVHAPLRRRLLAGALFAVTPLLGWSQQALPPQPLPLPQQADPPARVAYVSAVEGSAYIADAGADEWNEAVRNWPVPTGSRVAADPGARIELHGGATVLRLAGPASLEFTSLDEANTQAALTEGALSLSVRELRPGDRIEVDTPQIAVIAGQPGEYRVDADAQANTTRVAVYGGTAVVYGEAGQSLTIAEGRQVIFSGRDLSIVQRGSVPQRDPLDQWAAARDVAEDRSMSARYVSRDMPGGQLLDNYGEWGQDPSYGAVWYPAVADDWAPYREGRWVEVAPWGWTWVDDAPWGFAPSHYGRWAQIGPRWAWVPGPIAPRPVYAPALVGFVGGGSLGISVGAGLPAAAWFPLAPGEYWQPSYRASDHYRQRANWWGKGPIPLHAPTSGYRFQQRPEAVSFAPAGYVGGARARPGRFGDGRQLPAAALRDTRIVQPPPRVSLAPGAVRRPLPPRPGLSLPHGPEVRAPRIGSAVGGRQSSPDSNGSFLRTPGGANSGQHNRWQPREQLQRQPSVTPSMPPQQQLRVQNLSQAGMPPARAPSPFQPPSPFHQQRQAVQPRRQIEPQPTPQQLLRNQSAQFGNPAGARAPSPFQQQRQAVQPQRRVEPQPTPQQLLRNQSAPFGNPAGARAPSPFQQQRQAVQPQRQVERQPMPQQQAQQRAAAATPQRHHSGERGEDRRR